MPIILKLKSEDDEIEISELEPDEPVLPKEKVPEFDESMVSIQMTRLFEYILTIDDIQPAHIDDAGEILDYELNDEQLSQICGKPIDYEFKGIVGLRNVLNNEMADIDLCLPTGHCGWLEKLLGGKLVDNEEKKVLAKK